MNKLGQDKMIKGDEKEVKTKQSFCFPDHGITIEADSQEEAVEKLQEQLKIKK